jgi:hypothetical protein
VQSVEGRGYRISGCKASGLMIQGFGGCGLQGLGSCGPGLEFRGFRVETVGFSDWRWSDSRLRDFELKVFRYFVSESGCRSWGSRFRACAFGTLI